MNHNRAGAILLAIVVSPTSNILRRTFRISGSAPGTGFLVHRGGATFIVTADHLVAGLVIGDPVTLYDGAAPIGTFPYRPLPTLPVDVTVLQFDQQGWAEDELPIELSSDGSIMGGDVYLLGFPFHFHTPGHASIGMAVPLIRKGILSGRWQISGAENVNRWFIDAFPHPGFSGGPVVWMKEANRPQVIGVITSGHDDERVEPFGLTEAIDIRVAVTAIDRWNGR